MHTWHATPDNVGERLDSFVSQHLPELSRSFVSKLCERQRVAVNGTPEKPSYKLRNGDVVTAAIDLQKLKTIPKINLEILYEDDDCIVINKPAGVLTHSKGSFNPEGTVATFIQPKLRELDGERAGIVHRLDRATSGVIICAKNPQALSWLQKQFSQRKVNKLYYAVVDGHVSPTEAVIDMPIERHPRTPKLFRTSIHGKPAVTHYMVNERGPNHDLLELRPETGRTHQLRVHLKQLGHPIVGDTLYESPTADRLYLHAAQLEITLPSRERAIFTVPLPKSFYKKVRS